MDPDSRGDPALYIACYGADELNRHEVEFVLHFDQECDTAHVVRDNQSKKPMGYSWIIRNWDSLGSCRKVEQYLANFSFHGHPLIVQQM